MSKFANYDVRQWLDGVLSQHPETAQTETETKPRSGTLSNFAYSMMLAASIAILPGISAGEVAQPQTSIRSPNSTVGDSDTDKVYWIEAAPSPVKADSAVDGFNSYFNEIHAQLSAGGLLDVPSETREAARLALARKAPSNWIPKLASDLSKLAD